MGFYPRFQRHLHHVKYGNCKICKPLQSRTVGRSRVHRVLKNMINLKVSRPGTFQSSSSISQNPSNSYEGLQPHAGYYRLSRFLRLWRHRSMIGPAQHKQWESHQQGIRQDVHTGFAPDLDWFRLASGLYQILPYCFPMDVRLQLRQLPHWRLCMFCVRLAGLDLCSDDVQQYYLSRAGNKRTSSRSCWWLIRRRRTLRKSKGLSSS